MTQSRSIYLDYNATAPLLPEAVEAMRPLMEANFGNASSRHSYGRAAWDAVERARDSVAALSGAHPDEVVFTSGATESNFLSLLGRFDFCVENGKSPQSTRIAYSPVEHPCVISAVEMLIKRGAEAVKIPVDSYGRVDPAFFTSNDHFDIVTVMAVNHETGAVQPIQEISNRIDHEKTFFHCDAVQWAGRGAGGFDEWRLSAMSLSSHKLGGPKGVGALILRSGVKITPQIPGSQEAGLRGGTTNSLGIAGFGAAAQVALNRREFQIDELTKKREYLWQGLQTAVPNIQRTLPPDVSVCKTLHVRFAGMKGERVVDALDQLGVACSSGPACASGAANASPVLHAMGLREQESWEGVRFSLGHELSFDDLDEAVNRISAWHLRQSGRVA